MPAGNEYQGRVQQGMLFQCCLTEGTECFVLLVRSWSTPVISLALCWRLAWVLISRMVLNWWRHKRLFISPLYFSAAGEQTQCNIIISGKVYKFVSLRIWHFMTSTVPNDRDVLRQMKLVPFGFDVELNIINWSATNAIIIF